MTQFKSVPENWDTIIFLFEILNKLIGENFANLIRRKNLADDGILMTSSLLVIGSLACEAFCFLHWMLRLWESLDSPATTSTAWGLACILEQLLLFLGSMKPYGNGSSIWIMFQAIELFWVTGLEVVYKSPIVLEAFLQVPLILNITISKYHQKYFEVN